MHTLGATVTGLGGLGALGGGRNPGFQNWWLPGNPGNDESTELRRVAPAAREAQAHITIKTMGILRKKKEEKKRIKSKKIRKQSKNAPKTLPKLIRIHNKLVCVTSPHVNRG
jgi:hypothetical protein